MKVRTIENRGELWVSLEDLRKAINDEDLLLRAAAMLKVSRVEKHDDALKSIRMMIAYFLTEGTGVLAKETN